MLAYTLERLMESQQAVIERDVSAPNALGASPGADWQPIATVQCRFYWRKESGRGPAREVAEPQRTVAFSEGGAILPAGTDITDEDRIARVISLDGGPTIEGPFVIQAVFTYKRHIEVSWLSP